MGEEDVTQNVTTPGLHGADNGKYTCTATDDVGNYGAAQIAVQVVGEWLHSSTAEACILLSEM